MTVPSASPLFLRETEIRRGIELLFFGYANLYRPSDSLLAEQGLGRAHHRSLYFIARQPGMTIGALLRLLGITKQSLGRVLNELGQRDLIEVTAGEEDRRQRLLRLTEKGAKLEADLFAVIRESLSQAYGQAGQEAVTGFWRVLELMSPPAERARVAELGREPRKN
ncbi:MarR family winged helix-turn-helix transcriptional regulator [Sphingomonas sp.]|uniref:MarR family winged helix-turn-helix transcriptional regulator n=1 Tax=Sphingomonas sp. TaxID=28214 RepID=UPI000DB06F97|nr:MarR family transcriptional regulator [Sphingomonas sp.]PZU06603.1 MAG: MarR family transcriptional regulator [Sphingomonas sp.]